MLLSSAVDCGFEHWSVETKEYSMVVAASPLILFDVACSSHAIAETKSAFCVNKYKHSFVFFHLSPKGIACNLTMSNRVSVWNRNCYPSRGPGIIIICFWCGSCCFLFWFFLVFLFYLTVSLDCPFGFFLCSCFI